FQLGPIALMLLGGKMQSAEEDGKTSGGFPEEKIVIPVGVTPDNLGKYNLYEILGFGGEIGAAADLEALRKAYHKAVLLYHPDKAQFKTADGKEDRTVFLKIQEAFNVLSNETKRRAYDSQLPFDESIPTEERVQKALAKGPSKFFKLFGSVFARNARFAVHKPVPELGNMETPLDEVYKFYEYWVNFESWRDFTGVGAEHKPDEATSREEKRWMMKENERIAKKLKKKEMERLIALVAIAEKNDPRITAEKEKRRLAKENEKNAKESAIAKKAEEEAAAKAWAEEQEAEERAKQAASKADKEKLKKAQSKARNILRKLLRITSELGHGSGEYGVVSSADLELLCNHASLEVLNEINEGMGGEAATKDSSLFKAAGMDNVLVKVNDAKEAAEVAMEDEKIAREAKKRESEEKAAAEKRAKGHVVEREWTRDDLSMLSKCCNRYPAGTPSRWTLVVNYMNVQLKPADLFHQDEVIRAAFMLARNPHDIKMTGSA
ncbi:hypothetical protein EON65_39165, partial [archaeon]